MTAPSSSFPHKLPSTFQLIHGSQSYSSQQLETVIERWTRTLRQTPLQPGDPIALWSPNNIEFIVALIALRRAGLSIVPFHARASLPEIIRLVSHSGARWVLASPSLFEASEAPKNFPLMALPAFHEDVPLLSPLSKPSPPLSAEYLVYTSGSEGTPKGALLRESALQAHIQAAQNRLDLSPLDRWLACLPFSHVGGLALLLRLICQGGTLVLPTPPENDYLDETLQRYQITHLSLVPTQLKRWLLHRSPGPPLPRLRCVLVGGAPVPKNLLDQAQSLHLPLRLTYGLTETWSQAATAQADSPSGSVGPPLPGVEIQILNSHKDPCPTFETGTVHIRGPTLMQGYHNDPTATFQVLRNGWLQTQDRGYLDTQGNLWVTGRRSETILTGGENVDPLEVESVLETHPSVREACVVGIPDEEWGEAVIAVLTLKTGNEVSAENIRQHCKNLLASFKCPKRFEVVSRIPRTPSGKLKRAEVRLWLQSGNVEPEGWKEAAGELGQLMPF